IRQRFSALRCSRPAGRSAPVLENHRRPAAQVTASDSPERILKWSLRAMSALPVEAPPPPRSAARRAGFWLVALGGLMLAVMLVVTAFGPLIAPYNPAAI